MANVIVGAQANKDLLDLAEEYDAIAEKIEAREMGNDLPGGGGSKAKPGSSIDRPSIALGGIGYVG